MENKTKFIPYSCQQINQEDIDAVVEILRSDFLTQGPVVPRFEKAIAQHVDARCAVATNSATSALHIACAALGLGPGDQLWTSANTFVASANCGHYCGASVGFVDIDPETFNMCPAALEEKLVQAKRFGTLPKVIVPVHMCGQPPNMQRIGELAHQYGVRVIEDASHSLGAEYRKRPVGSCSYSDITVFSFHPVKIITTAEGGAAVTNSQKLAVRMSDLRAHGITREPARMTHAPDGPWYYEQLELGWNYRMNEIQGALGLTQLTRLGEFVARRREIATNYDQALANLPLCLPGREPCANSSWHLYVVRLKRAGWRQKVFESLRANGIGVNVHYIPVHFHPYYKNFGFKQGDFPVAEDYYSRAISIPVHPGLEASDQERVVDALHEALT